MSSLSTGTIIDRRYEILSYVGGGGMGEVYTAIEQDLRRTVAIKILPTSFLTDEHKRAQFRREGKMLSAVRHPNVITLYHFGITDNLTPYIAMELLKGETLHDVIHNGEPRDAIDVDWLLNTLLQVCNGVSFVHSQGIVHRDLKPANIMFADEARSQIKVLDFGLAKMLPDAACKSQHVTQTGLLIGTAPYMSPEQCAGHKADERSDIYALGCIMFEALTGSTPFDADSPLGVIYKHINDPVPRLLGKMQIAGGLSEKLDRVLEMALSKAPSKRYQSVRDLATDLDAIRTGRPPEIARKRSAPGPITISVKKSGLILSAACILTPLILFAALKTPWEGYIPSSWREPISEFEGDFAAMLGMNGLSKYSIALESCKRFETKDESRLCNVCNKLFASAGKEDGIAMCTAMNALLNFYTQNYQLLDRHPDSAPDSTTGIRLISKSNEKLMTLPTTQLLKGEDLLDQISNIANRLDPHNPDMWMVRIIEKKWAKKLHLYQKEKSALSDLASALAAQNNYEAAVKVLDELERIQFGPFSVSPTTLHLRKAYFLCSLTRYSESIAHANAALRELAHHPVGKRYTPDKVSVEDLPDAVLKSFTRHYHHATTADEANVFASTLSHLTERLKGNADMQSLVDSLCLVFQTKLMDDFPVPVPYCTYLAKVFKDLDDGAQTETQRMRFYGQLSTAIAAHKCPVKSKMKVLLDAAFNPKQN